MKYCYNRLELNTICAAVSHPQHPRWKLNLIECVLCEFIHSFTKKISTGTTSSISFFLCILCRGLLCMYSALILVYLVITQFLFIISLRTKHKHKFIYVNGTANDAFKYCSLWICILDLPHSRSDSLASIMTI